MFVGVALLIALESWRTDGWAWVVVFAWLPWMIWTEHQESKKLDANTKEMLDRLGNMGRILDRAQGAKREDIHRE
jgi:hypothetical protein